MKCHGVTCPSVQLLPWRQLTLERDAETIANYHNPSFVLDGWMPILEKVE